jgi:hypothetical protein
LCGDLILLFWKLFFACWQAIGFKTLNIKQSDEDRWKGARF